MTLRSFGRRVQVLEQRHVAASGFACILQRVGQTREEALATWEADNGPVGERQAFLIRLVESGAIRRLVGGSR